MLLVEQGFSRLALFQLSPHRPSSTGFHLVRADLAPSGARFPVAGEPARATIPLHPAGRAGSMEESEDR